MRSRWDGFLALMFIGGFAAVLFIIIRADKQPDVRINPTMSAQPSATREVLRTSEPQPTTTPAPKFELTQQAIDIEQAAKDAAATQVENDRLAERAKATTQAEREALEQARRMNDVAYIGAMEALDHQRTMSAAEYGVQATLQAGIVAKQQALDTSEIRSAQKLDEWNTLIRVGWLTAWRLLGLLTFAGGILWLFIKTSQRSGYERELLNMAHAYEDQIRTIHQEVTEKAKAEALRYSQIRDYVRDSVRVAGGDYHQFPPASDPGMAHWHNDRRTEVVGYMKDDGKVYTDNRGTFVKRGTLAELLDDIERGEYPAGGE